MRKLLPVLVFVANASALCGGSMAVELPVATGVSGGGNPFMLVGGMGGGTGGGVGGMTGGGMGGMTGGGMTGGGMGGMTGGGMGGMTGGGMTGGGMGGMTGGGMGNLPGGGMGNIPGMTGRGAGGAAGYSDPPGGGGDAYGRNGTTGNGSQLPQYYQCVTEHGKCSVSSALGSLRAGASCSCLLGGKGKIK